MTPTTIPSWSTDASYTLGATVMCAGRTWRAIRDTVAGEAPGVASAWMLLPTWPVDKQAAARAVDPRIGRGE